MEKIMGNIEKMIAEEVKAARIQAFQEFIGTIEREMSPVTARIVRGILDGTMRPDRSAQRDGGQHTAYLLATYNEAGDLYGVHIYSEPSPTTTSRHRHICLATASSSQSYQEAVNKLAAKLMDMALGGDGDGRLCAKSDRAILVGELAEAKAHIERLQKDVEYHSKDRDRLIDRLQLAAHVCDESIDDQNIRTICSAYLDDEDK